MTGDTIELSTVSNTTTATTEKLLEQVNQYLSSDWKAFLTPFGRIYYYNLKTNGTYWYPPESYWARYSSLPYGWEAAVDNFGRTYYINHINHITTYNDPREEELDVDEEDELGIIRPRDVEIGRDANIGFGFIAGSDKPVIVRFVLEDGPSHGKLLAGDQIIRVNGEYVENAPRDHVIDLIKNCKEKVLLTVTQPNLDNSNRKSAILSASKKARLKHKPSRVRFSERITVNGHPMTGAENQPYESCVHAMANILKVFLENGQTKSFKYDNKTTVRDVLDILKEKLNLKFLDYFCLVLQHIDDIKCTRLTLLYEDDLLSKIALRPGSQYYRCLFRVIYAPKNPQEIYENDKSALSYFYLQCFNDILQRRFRNTIKNDVILKLASLSIYLRCHQAGISKLLSSKISSKKLEQQLQIKKFVPESVYSSLRSKEILKRITTLLKKTVTDFKSLDEDQIKLEYLKIWSSDIILYGAQCYTAILRDKNLDIGIIISPKLGIQYYSDFIDNPESLVKLTNFEQIETLVVVRDNEVLQDVDIKCADERVIRLKINVDEAEDMILLLQGYYKLFTQKHLPLDVIYLNEKEAPPYYGKHIVKTTGWNYPSTLFSHRPDMEHIIDLSSSPPPFFPENEISSQHQSFKTFASRATQTANHPNQSNVIIEYSEIFSDQLSNAGGSVGGGSCTTPSESFQNLLLMNTSEGQVFIGKAALVKPETKCQEVMTDFITSLQQPLSKSTEVVKLSQVQRHKVPNGNVVHIDDNFDLKHEQATLGYEKITTTSKIEGPPPIEETTTDSSFYTSPEPSPQKNSINANSSTVTFSRSLFLDLPPQIVSGRASPIRGGLMKEPSFGLLSPDKIMPIMSFYESPGLFDEFKQQQQYQNHFYPYFQEDYQRNFTPTNVSKTFSPNNAISRLSSNITPINNANNNSSFTTFSNIQNLLLVSSDKENQRHLNFLSTTQSSSPSNRGYGSSQQLPVLNNNTNYSKLQQNVKNGNFYNYYPSLVENGNNTDGVHDFEDSNKPRGAIISINGDTKKNYYSREGPAYEIPTEDYYESRLRAKSHISPFPHLPQSMRNVAMGVDEDNYNNNSKKIPNDLTEFYDSPNLLRKLRHSIIGNGDYGDDYDAHRQHTNIAIDSPALLPKDPSNETLTDILYRNVSGRPKRSATVYTILDDIDIIDLTMIPVPKTPEQEKINPFLIDSNLNISYIRPPPGFGIHSKDPSFNKFSDYNGQSNNTNTKNISIIDSQYRIKPTLPRSFSDSILGYFDSRDDEDFEQILNDDPYEIPLTSIKPFNLPPNSGLSVDATITTQGFQTLSQPYNNTDANRLVDLPRPNYSQHNSKNLINKFHRAMSLNNVYFIKNLDEPLCADETGITI